MQLHPLHTQHPRWFESNRFVYPVLSRRSAGLSVGVNLNPDKVCNFDCIYCQVDRRSGSEVQFVETERLYEELRQTLAWIQAGSIYEHPQFAEIPAPLRRLNDIAFSGDGEPTTYRNFDELVASSAEVKQQLGLTDVKLVLITNASMFHRPHVQRGLRILDANQGEIWAKLDAGTQAYFQQVDRTVIPLRQVLDNILDAARQRPLVIQSLFMRIADQPPSVNELEAYCQRLNDILAAGGRLSLVQIYTVARRPAESIVTPLADDQVDAIVELVMRRTGLPVEGFYGTASG